MTKIPFVFKVLIVFVALSGAVGVGAVAIDDTITPQNCDRSNPVCAKFVETTSAGQIKWGAFIAGGLRSLTNLFVDGKLGVGTLRPSTGEQVLRLDIEGAVGARFYCDQDGNHCVAGDSLGQGGGGGSISITTINNSGLILNPTTITNTGTISIDNTFVQKRVSASCSNTSAIKKINIDGTVECQAVGTGGVSLPAGVLDGTLRYDGSNWVPSFLLRNSEEQVGIGMDLKAVSSTYKLGVNGGVLVMGVIKIAGGNPEAGKVLTSTDAYGNATWQTPTSNNGSVNLTQGTGITLNPTTITNTGTISIDNTFVQKRVSASCSNTSAIKKINIDGTVECQAVGTGGTSLWTADASGNVYRNTGKVGIGTGYPTVELDVNNGKIKTKELQVIGGAVTSGNVLTSDGLGNAIWKPVPAGNGSISITTTNNSGIVLNPTTITNTGTISIDFNNVQKRLSASCPIGQSIQGIDVNGLATCVDNGTSKDINWILSGTKLYPDSISYNVGIGTTNPTATLDVVGTLKASSLRIGSSSVKGQVLMAVDTNGNATWQTLPSTGGSPASFASCQQYRCIAYRLSGTIENKNEKWTTKCYKTTNENNTDDYPVPVSANVTSDVTFNFKPGVKDGIDYYSSGKVSSSNNSILMSANVACGRNDSTNGFRQSGSVLHSSSKVVTAVCDEREKRAMVLSATYCPS